MKQIFKNKKIRIAYLTSCRELGVGGGEKVGRDILDPDNGKKYGYRQSCLEFLANYEKGNLIEGIQTEIALVICDDNKDEENQEWHEHALWPKNLKLASGKKLGDVCVRLPSRWRQIQNKHARKIAKRIYMRRLATLLVSYKIDLVIVDSYMCIIDGYLLRAFKGRMINIHPGVLKGRKNNLAGAYPTRDALTRGKFGYIIIDDKHKVGLPHGRRVEVIYRGAKRLAVKVKKISETGVTVHLVTRKVDAGPVVAAKTYIFNSQSETEESLRSKNYNLKHEVILLALQNYLNGSLKHRWIFGRRRPVPAAYR